MKRWPEIAAAAAIALTLAGAVVAQNAIGPRKPVASKPAPPASGSSQVAGEPAPAPEGSFAIRDVRVFDGERMIQRANVIVREGRIVAVGTDATVPEGVPAIDGAGKTLLPGLFDAHVHAWGDSQHDMARFGVTSGFDMHGVVERLPALRKQRASSEPIGQADLWAAGYAITAPGGHGTQYGFAVPTIDAKTDIDAFIKTRVDEGADYIKLIIEDLSAYGSRRQLPTLSPQQVATVIKASHARKRLAVVHAAKLEDARLAIDADADGLVHVFADQVADDAFVADMRQRKAFIVPTLAVIASISGSGEGKTLAGDKHVTALLTAEQSGTLGKDFGPANPQRLQHALESVRKLHTAGVDILAGSDAPNPGTAHGVSLHHELALLVRAGLTPEQALAAATSLPAKRFGITDRGRIAPGMRADLVLVNGDPLADIAATRAIDTVWKNGQRIERDPRAGVPAAEAAPAQTQVSDFDGDEIRANFGSWQPTTDQMAGGTSQVKHAWAAGGAGDSRGALQVSGEIKTGFAYPWSGVMFFPASLPTQTMDLSARKELVFQACGDGRTYNALLFSGPSVQGMPSMQTFIAGPDWKEVRIPLSGFAGGDLGQVRGIGFTAGQPLGKFEFRIDQVELR